MISPCSTPRPQQGGESFMPTHLVNLDALIKREDFEAEGHGLERKSVFKLDELTANSIFLNTLRKPDFQRQTASWKPIMVAEFVKSFLDNDLIPYIIMWHSSKSGKIFVIDGAHRLSALIAWVNDDYGDGIISQSFFDVIPYEQRKFAKQTRDLLRESIGTYKDLTHVGLYPDTAKNDLTVLRARHAASFTIESQWVQGDAKTAEDSFFRINGNPATIDPTELDIIKARRKPNAIATRALMQGGTGHKYWAFSADKQKEIEDLAREIYNLLFTPIIESGILKTLDIPIAGKAYSAETFHMILDLVNIFNDITPAMWKNTKDDSNGKKRKSNKDTKPRLQDDTDGSGTVEMLKNVRKVGWLISGDRHPGSLGIHPVVYFWGATGRFHPSAFLAVLKFVTELKKKDQFEEFTNIRADFEEFLIQHRGFLNQLSGSKGSRTRPLESLVTLYTTVFSEMCSGNRDNEKIVDILLANRDVVINRKLLN